MPNPEITFSWNLEGIDKKVVSELIRLALPEFYDIFTRDHALITHALIEQLKKVSEVNQAVVAIQEGTPVGIICYFDCSELKKRQMASTYDLMRIPGDRTEVSLKLRQFTELIPPVNGGLYLSRVSVSPAFQGTPLAHYLLKKLEHHFRVKNDKLDIWLHVNPTNYRAIRFYEKNGFQKVTNPMTFENSYLLLRKAL